MTHVRTLYFVLLLTASSQAQTQKSDLSHDLRDFAWMIGDWELNSVRSMKAKHDDLQTHPTNRWLTVSANKSGGLTLQFEYRLRSGARIFNHPDDLIVRHTEQLAMKNGRLQIIGEIQTTQNGKTTSESFTMVNPSPLSELTRRGKQTDSLNYASYRTAIRATLVKSYANKRYQPFTPSTPKLTTNLDSKEN